MVANVIAMLPAEAQAAAAALMPGGGRVFDRGDHAELADALLETLSKDRSRLVCADGSIHLYEPSLGIWRPVSIETARQIVKRFAGCRRGEKGILGVSRGSADGAYYFATAEITRAGFFDGAPTGCAFTNGFVRIVDGKIELLPHSPTHRCRHGHAFDYDANAPHVELDKLLSETFGDVGPCERQARIWLLQEFTGACLVGLAPTYQLCLVLLGAGGNGKSQILIIIRSALPDGTVVSLPPQLWSERFQVCHLLGATANLCDELPEREFIESGAFKAIITGEHVHVERKYLDPFDARIPAGHGFAANALPGTHDLSEAFFRRFAVLQFTRRFDGTKDCRPNAGQAVVDACRPGIAAWALEGAARLQRQGKYTMPATSTVAVQRWRQEADSVATYIADGFTRLPVNADARTGVRASTLYGDYRAWCEQNGHRAVNATNFGKRMAALGLPSIHVSTGRFHLVRPGTATEVEA
jgi:P4 family phage/plasmid primase-like protien